MCFNLGQELKMPKGVHLDFVRLGDEGKEERKSLLLKEIERWNKKKQDQNINMANQVKQQHQLANSSRSRHS